MQEKSIVLDAGPIISLTTNNLLWILESLKKRFNGRFYISHTVRNELIEKPLTTKKFKFEGLQVLQLVNSHVLEVVDNDIISSRADALRGIANSIFRARGSWINIVQYGEMQSLAAARYYNSDLFVVDERTTRILIEDPARLQKILGHKLKTRISINKINLNAFKEKTKNINPIRSVELVVVAFKLGLLDKYMISEKSMSKAREQLLESILWGVKLHGCSVSEREIKEIVRKESF